MLGNRNIKNDSKQTSFNIYELVGLTGKSAYDQVLNTDRLLNLGKVVYEQKCGLLKYIEFRDSDLP